MNSCSVRCIVDFFSGAFGLRIAGTVALRIGGQQLLHPGGTRRLVLFAFSFPLMAWVARRLCSRFQLWPEEWPAGAISIALPTLVLDPFSSVFFPSVFPNMPSELAGVFGGWMLWCCAGALAGATIRPGRPL